MFYQKILIKKDNNNKKKKTKQKQPMYQQNFTEKITMFFLTLSNDNCWITKHKMAFTKLIPGITISLYSYFLWDTVH